MLLWVLFVGVLIDTLWVRMQSGEQYDEAALIEWVDQTRVFRDTLPELVRKYLEAAEAEPTETTLYQRDLLAEIIAAQFDALAHPVRKYQERLPLFPSIYRLELRFPGHNRRYPMQKLEAIVWESGVPRPRHGTSSQVRELEHRLLGPNDDRAILRFEYQLHAFQKRQHDEQAAMVRLRWTSALAVIATILAFFWIMLVQRQERERERQRQEVRRQISEAERMALEEEVRRQEAERRQQEAERNLLEQKLATQAAEQRALELKSQLYASIGIMAGSYAHNIKNLLVRPNDLLRRCLENNSLSPEQNHMLAEVKDTLGTVTERLQQILQAVRRDPNQSQLAKLDLNVSVRQIVETWRDLAREKWKLHLCAEIASQPLWVQADASHLQQAIENLLFNARDATFEMRSVLREQARQQHPDGDQLRRALIEAAAWKGNVTLRSRREGDHAVLEVEDNGIGMSEEVKQKCVETHFSTKRDNALYEGHHTGMGLGLSFVVVVLEHHHAQMEIDSEPMKGTRFRIRFPLNQ
ncbi:MAG: hypothetical protein KatS3mg105_0210 [Gemmatales bacterium]|nr:MAG: hypothetical protein KatS3mg105_0210 [Gemmatales bacterium]